MLRLASHIILSFLLLTSTIGLAVSKHYCGGDVKEVALFEEADSCCDMDGCCHNEDDFFQVKTDFTTAQVVDTPQAASLDMLFANLFFSLNDWQLDDSAEQPVTPTEILPVKDCSRALALTQVYRL